MSVQIKNGKKLTQRQMEKRDERIRNLYAKKLKSGKRKHTINGIADLVGLSKSRVHEIIKEGAVD